MSDAARGFPVLPGRREGSPRRRLDSWKEIASYLGRGERTVQRWAKETGLPVHRLHHAGGHTVYAYTDELDAWLHERSSSTAKTDSSESSDTLAAADVESSARPASRRRGWIVAAVLAAAAGLTASVVLESPVPDRGPARVSPLTSDAGWERHPDLSPDGKQVAYAHHDRLLGRRVPLHLYVRLVDGGEPLKLTDSRHHDLAPKWSPDQKSIAFARVTSMESAEIRMISALGGDDRFLFHAALPPFTARDLYGDLLAWTPGGDALLHTDRSVERPGGGAIWSYDMTSGRRMQLTRPGPGQIDFAPALSPDGGTLAFARRQSLDDVRLYLVELTSDLSAAGAETALASAGSWNTSPVWTPDGEEIVFCAGEEPSFSLWRIAPSPDAVPRVMATSVPGLVQIAAAQSADSGRTLVAETLDQSRDLLEIQTSEGSLPPDVSESRPVIRSSGADSFGRYSLDGGRIAFVSDRSGSREIWVRDLDGERAVQWTNGAKPLPNAPAWSPDGSRLAFASSAAGLDDVWVVDGPGSAPVRLTMSDPSREIDPLWSHDGEWIYFASDRGGPFSTWRIPAGGGEAESVGPRGFIPRWPTPDGRWLYGQLFSGGPPPVMRVALDGSDEAEVLVDFSREHAGPATIRASGIYALERMSEQRLDHAVRRWPLEGGEGRVVAKLPPSRPVPFDVSPDGKRILWERDMGRGYDLMLIEAAY